MLLPIFCSKAKLIEIGKKERKSINKMLSYDDISFIESLILLHNMGRKI